MISAAQKAATALAGKDESVQPDVALAILQRLGRLRTPEASAKLEVCPFLTLLLGQEGNAIMTCSALA